MLYENEFAELFQEGGLEASGKMLDERADLINEADKAGNTILECALNNTQNLDIIDEILRAGADVKKPVLKRENTQEYNNMVDNPDTFQEDIQIAGDNIDPNLTDIFGMSLLMLAQDTLSVYELLDKGANVNARDFCGLTSFFYSDNIIKRQILIDKGVDLNIKYQDGNSEIVNFLLLHVEPKELEDLAIGNIPSSYDKEASDAIRTIAYITENYNEILEIPDRVDYLRSGALVRDSLRAINTKIIERLNCSINLK
ncbi:MAG: hypothetical protein SFT68_03035 [Rickettsiaceae bacterium]|nr:hypothetical protein [Rickettsiaceae bacterium]